jgi:uncharacterized protein YqjF (DUF2071 family)
VHPFGPLTKNVPILAVHFLAFRLASPAVFLTARWRDLTLFTFAVPPDLVAKHLPPGVELDRWEGEALVSVVALDFEGLRCYGVPAVGMRRFPDVNFRVYVRHGERRGVVFLRELVPVRLIAWTARLLYREPFQCVPLRSTRHEEGGVVSVERRFEAGGRTHVLAASGGPGLSIPDPSSLAHFLKERSWGFGVDRAGRTIAYRVDHPLWEVLEVRSWTLDVAFGDVYGPEWKCLEGATPLSVCFARGSAVKVWEKQRIS